MRKKPHKSTPKKPVFKNDIDVPYFNIYETHNKHIDFELLLLSKKLISINQKSMIVNIKKPPYHIIRPSRSYQSFRNSFTNFLIKQYPKQLLVLTTYFTKHYPAFVKLDMTWGNINNQPNTIPLQGDIDAYIKILIDSLFNALFTIQKEHHSNHKKTKIDDKYINVLQVVKLNQDKSNLINIYQDITNSKLFQNKNKYVLIKGKIYKL